MFALDLFNNDHERRLTEGAVDTLEQRRIDDLAMKMDDLVARAKTATTTEVKAALMKEFKKCKAERDSYYKVADECMGYGGLTAEAGIPGNVPTEKIPGKEDLLKGKGRSYYEADQKKNSEEVSDPKIDRLLTKAHREFPRARSSAEALAMKILSKEQDDVARLERENDREDKMIDRLADLERNLQQQIDHLTPTGDLTEDQKLHVGDPIIVTAPNEFEGKTGEISELSPSGKFVIVNLYNHGEQPMHLSDVEFNQYAADQEDEDDWYDDGAEDTLEGAQDLTPFEAGHADGLSNKPYENPYPEGRPGHAEFRKGYLTGLAEKDLDEGFQDFNKVEPYAVCLAGKPVKRFDYYEQARKFHDNWKKKLHREGNQAKADKITLLPLNLDEAMNVNDLLGKITKDANKQFKKAKSGKLKSDGSDFTKGDHWKGPNKDDPLHTQNFGHGYPNTPSNRSHDRYVNKSLKNDVEEGAGPQSKLDQKIVHLLTNGIPADAIARKLDIPVEWVDEVAEYNMPDSAIDYNDPRNTAPTNRFGESVAEAQTDYQKRRQRERDINAGKPVARQRQPKMTDYQKKRAQDKKDMELGESQDTSGVESSIIRRIMIAHTDLLKQFGPEKVMQAAEEVAYNVGDVDEIGTSDVSAYVAQVRQILGAV